jgi:hypothetical protein
MLFYSEILGVFGAGSVRAGSVSKRSRILWSDGVTASRWFGYAASLCTRSAEELHVTPPPSGSRGTQTCWESQLPFAQFMQEGSSVLKEPQCGFTQQIVPQG